jgi:hypothetical protein
MKTEDQAWRELQRHAAAHLRPEFAERVLRAAQGPTTESWQQLQAHAAAQLRPGFAERVLRAARSLPGVPSLLDQLALSAATAALCLLGVVYIHAHNTQIEEQRNLAGWHQLAVEVQDFDYAQ